MKAMAPFLPAAPHQTALTRPLPPLAAALFRLAQTVADWEDRRLTRRRLATLDAHLLADIGLSAEAADAECAKPFWRR